MWIYEKKLQYPVNITKRDLAMAKNILTQYGGPQGELAAAIRYLNQRYTMPDEYGKALLTDIGTEELAHIEVIAAMVNQLTKGATKEEILAAGLGPYYSNHGLDLFPENSSGEPFTTAYISAVGDPIANIEENMAAEQKARAVYENLINLATSDEVIQPLLFLRQREIIHYHRYAELLQRYQEMGLQ